MAKGSGAGKATGRQKNIRYLLAGLAIVIIIVVLAEVVFFPPKDISPGAENTWSLSGTNRLTFNDRTPPSVKSVILNEAANYTLEKISYDSYGISVYGLLRIPKNVQKPPVVIILPAATVTKEANSPMAEALGSWGYASLTLDERGNGGETKGISPMDIMSGYDAYRNGGIPSQYAQIHDILLGYEYLRSRDDLDGGNILVLGESMGGRFSIIAAGIEPGLKAAFVVSSGPYGLDAGNNTGAQRFVESIEPATYLPELPPRKLVMFHFTGDPIIPVASGRALYDAASQPKAWYQYNGTVHGLYSDTYAPDLHTELESIFGR